MDGYRNAGAPTSSYVHWARFNRWRWEYVRVRVAAPGYLATTSRTVRVKGV